VARPAALGPMKATTARQMRVTAQQLDAAHPEMITGGHLRDAARVLEHGSLDGAKRHLDAAMETLTPRNLLRHGIADDDGHALAKRYMHQIHRHRLNVQDIEDARQRNEQFRAAVRAARNPDQQQDGQAAIAAASRRRAIELDWATWNAERRAGLSAGSLHDAEPAGGSYVRAGTSGESATHLDDRAIEGRFGHEAGEHIRGAQQAAQSGDRDSVSHHIQAADDLVTRHIAGQRPVSGAEVMQRNRDQGLLTNLRVIHRRAQMGAKLANPLELAGPHGYVHGWVKVGAPDPQAFGAGTQPGSFEHIRAIDDLANRVGSEIDSPGHASSTMQAALHNVAKAVAERNMPAALIHLGMAEQANRREAGRAWTRELATLRKQLSQVPGTETGWQGKIINPLSPAGQHPGRFVPSGALPAQSDLAGWQMLDRLTELSARTAMLERTPAPRGRPGGPGLYHVKGMGHTDYLQQIVKALIEKRGMPPGKAYAIARGAIRKWQRGGGHVHPEVRAAAGRAEAGELQRQARAHTHAISPWEVADTLIELATIDLYNPYHAPPGQGGGRFTTSSGAGGAQQQQAQRRREAKQVAARKRGAAAADRKGDRQQVAHIRAEIASVRSQLAQAIATLHALGGTGTAARKTGSAAAKKTTAAAAKKTAAAPAKTTAATVKAAASSRAAKATAQSQLRAQIGQLRARLSSLHSQLAQAKLANDEPGWAMASRLIELAAAWEHEQRNFRGEWTDASGSTKVAAESSEHHITTDELEMRLAQQRVEFMREMHTGDSHTLSMSYQKAMAGVRIAHAAGHEAQNKEDRERRITVIAYHIGIVVAGAILAGVALGLGVPALVALVIGATPPVAQEIVDYWKKLA
jgi:hypothetical protein